MVSLIITVFVASLTGSLHCVGMCGPFLAVAAGIQHSRGQPNRLFVVAYHCGRLLSYSTLGAIAGFVGSAINLGGRFIGIQRCSGVLAGVMIVTFGLFSLLRIYGFRVSVLVAPNKIQRLSTLAYQIAFRLQPTLRAAIIGVCTTLLPCGWLYAFVITAAGTGNSLSGMLTMAVFWVGTLPALTTLGVGIQKLTGTMAPRLALVTCIAIIIVGLYTVCTRFSVPDQMLSKPSSQFETTISKHNSDQIFEPTTRRHCYNQHNE